MTAFASGMSKRSISRPRAGNSIFNAFLTRFEKGTRFYFKAEILSFPLKKIWSDRWFRSYEFKNKNKHHTFLLITFDLTIWFQFFKTLHRSKFIFHLHKQSKSFLFPAKNISRPWEGNEFSFPKENLTRRVSPTTLYKRNKKSKKCQQHSLFVNILRGLLIKG